MAVIGKAIIQLAALDLFKQYQPAAEAIINGETLIDPDFIIGEDYLRRWWLGKIEGHHDENRLGPLRTHTRRTTDHNCYLHKVTGSDDDRAMHDHPWVNASLLLAGSYKEHTPVGEYIRKPGEVVIRNAEDLHRLELVDGPVWSLFITGPKIREWGFMCPAGRWVHWREFTSYDETGDSSRVGRGCGEP